jgi:uncharacterized membrane protein YbhN (UPF0104 family)
MNGRGRLVRLALLAAGLALVAWLVRSAGAEQVLAALERAGPWLPLVVLLEAMMPVTDFVASRALVGVAAPVAPSSWVRASCLAYASSILLPAGRAAGEATRAATLAPTIGVARATAACTRLQAAVLLANGVASAVIMALVLAGRETELLAAALLGNAVVCAALGAALVLLLRNEAFKTWLRARFPRLVGAHAPAGMPADRAPVGLAVLLSVFARAAQAAQYGVVVHAVGGVASPRAALAAQGIHLVGAAVGDAVPGQLGATEGAYRLFASVLHMGASQALSVALVVRAAQLALASLCFGVGLFASRQLSPAELR